MNEMFFSCPKLGIEGFILKEKRAYSPNLDLASKTSVECLDHLPSASVRLPITRTPRGQ